LINAASEFVETDTIAPESTFQRGQIHSPQVADRLYFHVLQLFLRNFANTGNAFHRQRQKKRIYLFRLNDKETIRLFPVRSNLRQEFVRCYACRRCQAELSSNLFANAARDLCGRWQASLALRNVEIGFVERQRFDQVGVALEDLANLGRYSAIA